LYRNESDTLLGVAARLLARFGLSVSQAFKRKRKRVALSSPQENAVSANAPRSTADSSSPATVTEADGAPFFKVTMLPAGHGDALWIEYGRTGAPMSRVLVDCGTTSSYQHLKARILRVPLSERRFDLFLMSHIDSDHIGGALSLLAEVDALGVRFDDVWFNGRKHLTLPRESVHQGEVFSELIVSKKLRWNAWKKGGAIVRADNGAPSFTLRGGMKITLMSPTRAKLVELADTWDKELAVKDIDVDEALQRGRVAETSEDVPWLADVKNRPFKEDAAAPNGSSIAVLAEFAGKRLLLGADAHPGVLEQAIQGLLKAPGSAKKLRLDAFKVSHHASQNNLSPALLKLINCRHYLVSTNGAVFGHPDRVAVARIIQNGGPQPHLWFNYRSKHNEVWAKPALQSKYQYDATFAASADSGLSFSLI
jgi:beta-lactamase superfamily II metal-dependent hydrolase